MLTGGNIADCTTAASLLDQLPDCRILHADKGYDSNTIRRRVEARDILPNIPPQGQPALEELFLAGSLPRPKRHRADVLPAEGFPAHRHPIRPPRNQLPRRGLHRGHRQLLVMSPDPRSCQR